MQSAAAAASGWAPAATAFGGGVPPVDHRGVPPVDGGGVPPVDDGDVPPVDGDDLLPVLAVGEGKLIDGAAIAADDARALYQDAAAGLGLPRTSGPWDDTLDASLWPGEEGREGREGGDAAADAAPRQLWLPAPGSPLAHGLFSSPPGLDEMAAVAAAAATIDQGLMSDSPAAWAAVHPDAAAPTAVAGGRAPVAAAAATGRPGPVARSRLPGPALTAVATGSSSPWGGQTPPPQRRWGWWQEPSWRATTARVGGGGEGSSTAAAPGVAIGGWPPPAAADVEAAASEGGGTTGGSGMASTGFWGGVAAAAREGGGGAPLVRRCYRQCPRRLAVSPRRPWTCMMRPSCPQP